MLPQRFLTFKINRRRGQVALIVLLVSVVGLTLVLAVASQMLSGLRRTEEIAESSRALSAAEAGIEEALFSIEAVGLTPILTPTPIDIPGEDSSYEYTVYPVGNTSEVLFRDFPLKKDEVLQVDLEGTGGNVTVLWGEEGVTPASLVLTFYSEETAGSVNYLTRRYAFNYPGSARDNGFDDAVICETYADPYGNGCQIEETTFLYKTVVSEDYLPIPGQGQRLLRIRALYNQDEPNLVGIMSSDDFILPVQYSKIVSKGFAGETQRQVQAIRSSPHLSSFFDYGILSNAGINKVASP